MPRGKDFWGTRDELLLLCKHLTEYYLICSMDESTEEAKMTKTLAMQRFWDKVTKEYYARFKMPEHAKKKRTNQIKSWFRNKRFNNVTADEVRLDLVIDATREAPTKKEKTVKKTAAKKAAKKTVSKGIVQYLHGRRSKRMKTAQETYAKEYPEEFDAVVKPKWIAFKNRIIAGDEKLQKMSEAEQTIYFRDDWLTFRQEELKLEYEKQSDAVKERCEKRRRELKKESEAEIDPDKLRLEAVTNAADCAYEALKDLSETTGFSFFLIGGGPDPRCDEEIHTFTANVSGVEGGRTFKSAHSDFDALVAEYADLLEKNYEDRTKWIIFKKAVSEEGSVSNEPVHIPKRRKRVARDSDKLSLDDDPGDLQENDSQSEEEDTDDYSSYVPKRGQRRIVESRASTADDSEDSPEAGVVIGNEEATDEILYRDETEAACLADDEEEFRLLTKIDMAVDYDNGTDDTESEGASEEEVGSEDNDGSDWEDIDKGNITKEECDKLYKRAKRVVKKSIEMEEHMADQSSSYDSDAEDEERHVSVDAKRYTKDIDYEGVDLEDIILEDTSSALADEDRMTEQNTSDGEEYLFESFHGMKSASDVACRNVEDEGAAGVSAVGEVDDSKDSEDDSDNEGNAGREEETGEHELIRKPSEQGRTAPPNALNDLSPAAAEVRLGESNGFLSLVNTLGNIQQGALNLQLQERERESRTDPFDDDSQVPDGLMDHMNSYRTPVKLRESRVNEYAPAPDTPDFATPKPPSARDANSANTLDVERQDFHKQLNYFGSSPLTSPGSSAHPAFGMAGSSWDTDTPVFSDNTSMRRNIADCMIPWVARTEEFIKEKLGAYSLSIGQHYRRFEELHGNRKTGGFLWKANLMPQEMKNFTNFHSFTNLRIPPNAAEFGKVYSPWYEAIQPLWRPDPTKRHTNCKKNILFNDSWSLPPEENWEHLNVGGLDGFVLAIIGVAIWSESAKRDPRGRKVSLVIERTIVDIHEVLEMMVAYMEQKEDEREEKGKKRVTIGVTVEEEKRAGKRAKTRKSGKENRT